MVENGYTIIVNDNTSKEYEKIITTPVMTFYKESGEQKIEIPIKYKGKTEQTINLCLNIKICEEEQKGKAIPITIVRDKLEDNISNTHKVIYEKD